MLYLTIITVALEKISHQNFYVSCSFRSVSTALSFETDWSWRAYENDNMTVNPRLLLTLAVLLICQYLSAASPSHINNGQISKSHSLFRLRAGEAVLIGKRKKQKPTYIYMVKAFFRWQSKLRYKFCFRLLGACTILSSWIPPTILIVTSIDTYQFNGRPNVQWPSWGIDRQAEKSGKSERKEEQIRRRVIIILSNHANPYKRYLEPELSRIWYYHAYVDVRNLIHID